MLNVNEIRNLEDKWKRYKRKKYLKFFIYILSVFVLAGVFLLYYLGFFNQFLNPHAKTDIKKPKSVLQNKADIKEVKNTPLKAKVAKPIKKKDITDKNNTNSNTTGENNKTITKEDKNISKISAMEENSTKAKNIFSAVTVKNEIKKNIPLVKSQNTKNSDILQLNTKFLSHIYSEKNSTEKPKVKNADKSNKSESNLTQESNLSNTKTSSIKQKQKILPNIKKPKKAKIIISSKKIDKLKYLKERYNETGRAFYAILISKEYYKKRLYLKSLLWATTANSIDSSSEESWIMFAKNKVKLGKKNDAINALSAYLRVNNSKKIKILLTNIKNGVFK